MIVAESVLSAAWPIVLAAGVLALGVVQFMGYFRKGQSDAAKDTIALAREQIGLLDTKVNQLTDSLHERDKEVAALKSTVKEQGERITYLQSMVMGPEAVEVIVEKVSDLLITRVITEIDRVERTYLVPMVRGVAGKAWEPPDA